MIITKTPFINAAINQLILRYTTFIHCFPQWTVVNHASVLKNNDVVYHLVSTNVPTTSNQHISQDIEANVLFSSHLFEAWRAIQVKGVRHH